MNNAPAAKAHEQSRHVWWWVLATIVLFIVHQSLNTQMDEKYRGFWGGIRANNDPASVTQLALWIQAIVIVTLIAFLVSCYKVYWRFISRVLTKHGTSDQPMTDDRAA